MTTRSASRPPERTLRRLARDRRASVTAMAALTLVVVTGMAALAVDLGTLYLGKRRLQGATDLAALAAATDLARPRDAAGATFVRNGFGRSEIRSLETGSYVADPALAPADRFTPLPATASGINAVRLVTQRVAPLYFGRVFAAGDGAAGVTLTSRAVATRTNFAAIAIGSRLAALDGGLLNGILSGLLGTSVSLTLMDYQALAGARVDLVTFLDAAATRANLTAGTYDSLLATRLRVGDVLGALAQASRTDPQAGGAASAALQRLALAKAASPDTVPLRGLVDLGPQDGRRLGTGTPGVAVAALDLLTAAAQAANGAHQVQVALATNLPGIASATATLLVGQRPVGTSFVAVGSQGATVSTAQARLFLKVQLLGTAPLGGVTLPILIDLARSTASLASVQCEAGDSAQGSATLAVQPGLAEAWIGTPASGDLASLSAPPNPAPAVLVQIAGLATVTGRAHASVANLAPTTIPFSAADIAQGVRKRASTTDYVAALIAALNRDLTLQASVAGLGSLIDAGGLTAGAVGAAAPALDALIANVLASLGLAVGQADVWVAGVRCMGGVLVN